MIIAAPGRPMLGGTLGSGRSRPAAAASARHGGRHRSPSPLLVSLARDAPVEPDSPDVRWYEPGNEGGEGTIYKEARVPTAHSAAVAEDEVEEGGGSFDDANDEDAAIAAVAAAAAEQQERPPQNVGPKHRTRRQISQLRYVMIHDVESMIHSSDAAERKAAPARAQENIDRLERLLEETGDESYRPGAAMYNSLVRAHAKSGRKDAAKRAEKVLESMRKAQDDGKDAAGMRPDATTYTAVIDALARSTARDAPVRAEKILFRMMDEAEEAAKCEAAGLPSPEGGAIVPTSITCDAVLNAWARRGSREGAERAEKILARMEALKDKGAEGSGASIRPTAYSYATVISAWAHSRGGAEAAEKAEAVMEKMLKDWSKRGNDESAVRPNAVVFNAVIDAWSRSGDPRAGTKAVELLDRMERLHEKEGGDDDDLRPDVITYNSVINAWSGTAGCADAAKSAEEVFRRLESDESAQPNTRTYNSLLKAWGKSRLPGAAAHVDEILQNMIDAAGSGSDVRPDVISFSTALDAWAKSKEVGKARRARSILDRMVEFHMKNAVDDSAKPNAVCYNAVLNACAFSASAPDPDERKHALSTAVSTFNDCRTAGFAKPDSVTYGTMLKCVANLVPVGDMKDRMAAQLFGKCRDDGLVSRMVLAEVQRAVSAEAATDLLQSSKAHLEVSDLPSEWTRNVTEKKARRHSPGGGRRGKRKGGGGKGRKGGGKHGGGAEVEDKPILPIMRGLTETSWQSGKDV